MERDSELAAMRGRENVGVYLTSVLPMSSTDLSQLVLLKSESYLTRLVRFHFSCSGIRSVENSFGTRVR